MAMTLSHPLHKHALIRRQLSECCSLRCYICDFKVCGLAYCCEEDDCSFLLHESCALVELLQQITNHTIPPDHLLHIKGRPECQLCNVKFDALPVIATLPPLEEENIIKHVAHGHSLIATHVKRPNLIKCKACGERVYGLAYGCHSCSFFLHETCSRLPQEMLQHPFHPEHPLTLLFEGDDFLCKACHTESSRQLANYCQECEFEMPEHPLTLKHGSSLVPKVEDFTCMKCDAESSHQLRYHCQECRFELDVTCAILPLHLQDQEKENTIGMDHFSHQHRLLSGHVEERKHIKLRCTVCELQIYGEVYYCPGCILFIHKLCAEELPKEIVHYLHPEHPLILLQKPLYKTGIFGCDCCQDSYSGMVFHCASCKFDLDPKCALQTYSAFRDGVASKIQHFGHDHPLMLRYFKYDKISDNYSICKVCCMITRGPVYSCDKCHYVLHKSCAELPLRLEHPLHPLHPLSLLLKAPAEYFVCYNCRLESNRLAFYCSLCDFYLCKACATKIPTLKHQLHEHTLAFFEKGAGLNSLRCHACRRPCKFDFYRCTTCNFNLHGSCMPLPQTIQHKCHERHPLVLFDRFIDGRPDDLYCDYCEEIRNPDHGVYHCEECPYTVHIGCVLPQVTQPVNPDLDKLRKKIASLEETIKEQEKGLEALKQELVSLQREAKELSD